MRDVQGAVHTLEVTHSVIAFVHIYRSEAFAIYIYTSLQVVKFHFGSFLSSETFGVG